MVHAWHRKQTPSTRRTSAAATLFASFGLRIPHRRNGPGKEKAGAIDFLDPAAKVTLGTVNLTQCGIFSLDLEPLGANRGAIRRYVAEVYVQGMQVDLTAV